MFDKALVTPSFFHLPGVVHLPNPKRSFSGPENATIGPISGSLCILSQTISIRYHGPTRATGYPGYYPAGKTNAGIYSPK